MSFISLFNKLEEARRGESPIQYFERIKGSEGPARLKKYPDKHGYSIGYGHFIRKGENFDKGINMQQAWKLYADDTREKINFLKGDLGKDLWGRLPFSVKQALVDLDYRGDYRKKPDARGKEYKWVKLFKKGKFLEAAEELRDHDEARKSRGIRKRIDRNAKDIADWGIALKEKQEKLDASTQTEPFFRMRSRMDPALPTDPFQGFRESVFRSFSKK